MIYIYSPAYQVSGGPEALQQLGYYLRSIGKDAVIVFYNIEDGKNPMPERYLQYGNKWIMPNDIIDSKENSIVVPERKPLYLNHVKHAKRHIWWLSKDNFIYERTPLFKKIKYYAKRILGICVPSLDTRYCSFDLNGCTHLCGSKYAYEYVKNVLSMRDVRYCVEPISLDFLKIGGSDCIEDREDAVLYNPSKPSETMDKLLDSGKFNYIPLKGYNPYQLADLYRHTKLYVDFGAFPGPERIPKEMVYFGGQIIVGSRNAAENDFDVAVPEIYKIKDTTDIEAIENLIASMMNDYSLHQRNFDSFRDKVCKLDENFKSQIKEIFA